MKLLVYVFVLSVFILGGCDRFIASESKTYSDGPPYEAKGNRILDHEDILSEADSLILNELFLAHERKTSNQIALVTTDTLNGYENLAQFATFYFNDLGLGRKDLNNGIGIAVSRSIRSCFIATGYGTEVVMRDKIVKEIVDNLMIPELRAEHYFEGILAGSEAVIDYLERPENRMDL